MLYKIVRFLVSVYLHLIFRIRVEGEVPQKGSFLLCANHTSFYDAPLIAACIKRQLRFMAKKELFSVFLLGPMIRSFGAFPVSRGGSALEAVKTSLSILKQGEGMLMFPEGTRKRGQENLQVKSGMIMIAERAGAPIVPLGISATYRPFSKITVRIGEPIFLERVKGRSSEDTQKLAENIMEIIYSLAKV